MYFLPDAITRYSTAIVVVRAVVSSVFLLHGSQKVFGLFGGKGITAFVGWITSLGLPAILGYAGAYAELIGGLMVGLGIATEAGALLLAVDMCAAIYLVHWSHGYFITNNGYEYALNLVLLCVALIISGPGKWYLWDPFTR